MPIVETRTTTRGAFFSRRMTVISTAAPKTSPTSSAIDQGDPEGDVVLEDEQGEDDRADHAHVADGEVDDPRRPVDEHDADGDDGDGQPLDDPVVDDLRVDPTRRPASGRHLSAEEDGSSQVVALHQLGDGTLEAHLALLHEDGPVGDGGRDVERLLDDDHRDALALEALDTSMSSCTTIGASPSDSSSIMRTSGSWRSAMARASICCWPPESVSARLPLACSSAGNMPRTRSMRRREVGPVAPIGEAAHLQVLRDGHLAEDAPAAGQEVDAEPRTLLGRGVGDGAAVEAHDAALGRDEPGRHPQRRRLARAVGARAGQDLAAPHLEADVEEHLDVPVAEVDVVELQDRDGLRIGRLAPVLLLLLLELEHDEGEVVADEVRAADDHDAADDRGWDHRR